MLLLQHANAGYDQQHRHRTNDSAYDYGKQMIPLTLAKLAEIEQAAEDALKWRALTGDGRYLGNVCDPATVAALCRIARAAVEMRDLFSVTHNLSDALRAAGLIEP